MIDFKNSPWPMGLAEAAVLIKDAVTAVHVDGLKIKCSRTGGYELCSIKSEFPPLNQSIVDNQSHIRVHI